MSAMTENATKHTIRVNGQDEAVSASTLASLLEEKGIDGEGRGLALALNGAVIPRTAWAQTALSSGDTIEVVRAKQGG